MQGPVPGHAVPHPVLELGLDSESVLVAVFAAEDQKDRDEEEGEQLEQEVGAVVAVVVIAVAAAVVVVVVEAQEVQEQEEQIVQEEREEREQEARRDYATWTEVGIESAARAYWPGRWTDPRTRCSWACRAAYSERESAKVEEAMVVSSFPSRQTRRAVVAMTNPCHLVLRA